MIDDLRFISFAELKYIKQTEEKMKAIHIERRKSSIQYRDRLIRFLSSFDRISLHNV